MTSGKLQKILESHQRWLNGEDDGERADLQRADLRGANLRGADLQRADLRGAKNIMSFQAGNSNRVCYAVKHEQCTMFQIGCFWGNTEEAIKKIREDENYGEGHHYEKLVLLYTEILGEEK